MTMFKEPEDALGNTMYLNEIETEEILQLSPGSLAVGFIDEICTVNELINRIMEEAKDILSQGVFARRV